jgi:hypothetical protein
LRLDIDKNVNPDIVGTMLDMSAVADASVDAVFSSHNIEHLYPHEAPIYPLDFNMPPALQFNSNPGPLRRKPGDLTPS